MNKITKRLKSFAEELPVFGFFIAITNVLWPFIARMPRCMGSVIMKRKHQAVFRFIRKTVGNDIPEDTNECKVKHKFPSAPIWVCWLQGEEQMPNLCRTCMASLRKHAAGHPVVIITEANFQDYCYVPQHIVEKYKNGNIKPAHFADIIRTCLLYEHGGLWTDATLFIKHDLPAEIFDSPYYSIRYPNIGYYITECRWSNFFLSAKPHNRWYGFVRRYFFAYLQKEPHFVDYFMMDYLMRMAYDTDERIKEEVDMIPSNNEDVLYASSLLSLPINKENAAVLGGSTYLFKLSWRLNPLTEVDGKMTVWSYLQQKYL